MCFDIIALKMHQTNKIGLGVSIKIKPQKKRETSSLILHWLDESLYFVFTQVGVAFLLSRWHLKAVSESISCSTAYYWKKYIQIEK